MESLQPPRTGRSRFSKALPAPPPMEMVDQDAIASPRSQFPPRSTSTRPPLDSPVKIPDGARSPMTITRRPVALPISPRPIHRTHPVASDSNTTLLSPTTNPTAASLATNNTSTNTATAAAATTNTTTTTTTNTSSATSTTSSTVLAPAERSSLAPPSPVHSISSLLSAYSRDSEETTARSSAATEISPLGSVTFKPAASPPYTYTLPSVGFHDSLDSADMMAQETRPPLPPAKDGAAVPARKPLPSLGGSGGGGGNPSRVSPPPALPAKDGAGNSTPPPVPSEIWKRRSDKTDKTLGVSELRLTATNGSTSASQASASSSPALRVGTSSLAVHSRTPTMMTLSPSEPRLRSPQPPRSGGLPGRNIRPTGSANAENQIQMGPPRSGTKPDFSEKQNATSQSLQQQHPSLISSPLPLPPQPQLPQSSSSLSSSSPLSPPSSSLPLSPTQQQKNPIQSPGAGIRRLPTPDYEQHDIKSPIVEHVVSPVSPASSPDLIGSYLGSSSSKTKPLPSAPAGQTLNRNKIDDDEDNNNRSNNSNNNNKALGLPPTDSPVATTPTSARSRMGNVCTFPKSPRNRPSTKESSESSTHNAAAAPRPAPSPGIATSSSTITLANPASGPGSATGPPASPATSSRLPPASLQLKIPDQSRGQAPPLLSTSPSGDVNPSPMASPRDQFPARTTSRPRGPGLPPSPLARIHNEDRQLPDGASVTESFLENEADVSQVSTIRPSTSYQRQPRPHSPAEPRLTDPNTVYREVVQTDDFDPSVARFPATKLVDGISVQSGQVWKMRPMSLSQRNCFHRHRFMVPTSNSNYALACQTCGREDAEDRFRCKFCYLRVCVACRDVLVQTRGDVDALMDRIHKNAVASSPAGAAPTHARSGSTHKLPTGLPGPPVVTPAA